MAESYSIKFVKVVRTLERIANQRGFNVPTFRSPPPTAKFQRTVKKQPDKKLIISIVVRERPWLAVLADIIEGFVLANKPSNRESELRDLLWDSISSNGFEATERKLPTYEEDFVSSAA